MFESRRALIEAINNSKYLQLVVPAGSMYAFVGVDLGKLPQFDDEQFALDLLEKKHVLIAPGTSFNVDYKNHFRITLLPDADQIADVFQRIEALLDEYAK